jgi:hypothetical protein
MRGSFKALSCLGCALLAGCGTGSMDLSGYPDRQRDRLYENGRLGGDNGYANFDLRKIWRAVTP